MKIDINKTHQRETSLAKDFGSVIRKTVFVILIFAVCFITGIELLGYAEEAWTEYRRNTSVSILNANKTVNIQHAGFSASYIFPDVCYDNYLQIELSGYDVYKVAFSNDGKNDYMFVSTVSCDDSRFLYLIPDRISEQGYDKIQITPLSGDGVYWARNTTTISDPDFSNYSDFNIIDFEIKKLEININEDNMKKIEDKREEALWLGILIAEDSDYVPAVIYAEGKKDSAEVRLKGDWTDHLAGDKWSFRIKLDNDCIWGMSKISIQTPESREGIGEYLIHRYYSDQGGVGLRYDFVDVVVNGEYKGVYAIEEAFDKRVVESASRREGPIIKLSEDYLWENWAYYINSRHDSRSYTYVDVFSINKTLKNETLSGYASYAVDSLNRFIRGEASAEEVFDLELYAKYLAILDIFDSNHGNTWHNMRYYFNPFTAKLEPITFDELALSGPPMASKKADLILSLLFKDDNFVKLYVQSVKELVENYDDFIDSEQESIQRFSYILSRDSISSLDYGTILESHHDHIKEGLVSDDTEFYGKINEKNQLVITIEKNSFFNVSLKEISFNNVPLNVRLSNYTDSIIVDWEIQDSSEVLSEEDLQNFKITYETLFNGQEYTKALKYNELSFYIAGHVYGSPAEKGTEEESLIYKPFREELLQFAQDDSIKFGILTGDTVWLANDECYDNLVDALSAVGKPYYIAPGNHCLNDGGAMFEKYIGPQYQSFVCENNLFVFVTPREDWILDDIQIAFLEDALNANSNVDNIFLFSHQLMWLEKDDPRFPGVLPNSWEGKYSESNFWLEIYPLFEDLEQDVYFIAGDVGMSKGVVYETIGNRYFIASGMGNGVDDNYLIVDIDNTGEVSFRLISLIGDDPNALKTLESHSIRPE